MTGAELITAERQRQVERYAWDDIGSVRFELADCARMIVGDVIVNVWPGDRRPEEYWPADRAEHVEGKYGDNLIARLAIAGALIAAEIDRLQQVTLTDGAEQP